LVNLDLKHVEEKKSTGRFTNVSSANDR
jgi:hypothetical protein